MGVCGGSFPFSEKEQHTVLMRPGLFSNRPNHPNLLKEAHNAKRNDAFAVAASLSKSVSSALLRANLYVTQSKELRKRDFLFLFPLYRDWRNKFVALGLTQRNFLYVYQWHSFWNGISAFLMCGIKGEKRNQRGAKNVSLEIINFYYLAQASPLAF